MITAEANAGGSRDPGRVAKILILGGYGTFGGRLARLLAEDPGLTLMIAGRSRDKAAAFIARLGGEDRMSAVALDRDGNFAARLAELAPDLVVDASGPFQAYGADPYRIVEACIAAGVNYVDLADSSEFVAGIGRSDQAARRRGVFVLSGASTCPALSTAVARTLADGLTSVNSITGGIAPSPFAQSRAWRRPRDRGLCRKARGAPPGGENRDELRDDRNRRRDRSATRRAAAQAPAVFPGRRSGPPPDAGPLARTRTRCGWEPRQRRRCSTAA